MGVVDLSSCSAFSSLLIQTTTCESLQMIDDENNYGLRVRACSDSLFVSGRQERCPVPLRLQKAKESHTTLSSGTSAR